jgi:hypothetical protein
MEKSCRTSLSEKSLSIGSESAPAYTKIGEGMIQSGKLSMTTSAENSGDLNPISEIWVDTGVDGTGMELTEEGLRL